MNCSCYGGWLLQYNKKVIEAIYNNYEEVASEHYKYAFLGNTNQHRSLLTFMKYINSEFTIEYCEACEKYYYKVIVNSDELINQ